MKTKKLQKIKVWIVTPYNREDYLAGPDVPVAYSTKKELLKDLLKMFEGWETYAVESKTFEQWVRKEYGTINLRTVRYNSPVDLLNEGFKLIESVIKSLKGGYND